MGDTAPEQKGVPAAKDRPVARWRWIVCGLLVVLVCILAPVSVLAVTYPKKDWDRNG